VLQWASATCIDRAMEKVKRVAVCYSVWQCVAVCCSVLQYVAVCCRMLQCVAACCSEWASANGVDRAVEKVQHVAAYCSVL